MSFSRKNEPRIFFQRILLVYNSFPAVNDESLFESGTCPAFTPGDGKGSGEEKISETLTGRACIAECESRQEKDSTINGATVWADAGKKGCWCEKQMNGVNAGSTKYKTCKFEGRV